MTARIRRPVVSRLVMLAAVAGVGLGVTTPSQATSGGAAGRREGGRSTVDAATVPSIRHVFVIVLENEGFDTTFRPGSHAPYLADSMPAAGAELRQYYGIGHFSLDNYIAMISGIAPDSETQRDCRTYADFVETGVDTEGQPVGHGCVYPPQVPTLVTQLAAHGLTWKGYMEDMGSDPTREAATCGHPPIGTPDPTERATPVDGYAAKHDPFVYFHAILDSASCGANVVPLTDLTADLDALASTPNLAFIVPNLCHDGHDRPCAGSEPGGLVSADRFLAHWIPLIRSAPAYSDALIVVTFDETDTSDASACCGEAPGPNVARPGLTGPGGGRTGAVLLSPFIAPGTVSDVPYNHYSLLRSLEAVFGLPYLGFAGRQGVTEFGVDVFGAAAPH